MKTINEPLISVIIPTFNRKDLLPRAINSVINQTYKNWEIIIVDSSITDKTQTTLIPYSNNFSIQYFYKKNLNSCESINYGIKYSKGKFIALLDDDDEFIETKLEKQLFEMINHNVNFSFSNCFKIYDGKKASPKFYPQSFIISRKDFLSAKFHLSHTHMMFNSSIKEDCLFDPSLPASDDFDLIARIIDKHKILFIKEPLSYIHKSFKRKRISINTQSRIKTFEGLIKKVSSYNWTEKEKQKAEQIFKMQLGFWQMLDGKYKDGRKNMRKFLFLPSKKRIKFIFAYYLSFFPFAFKLTKVISQNIMRLSAGKIKL